MMTRTGRLLLAALTAGVVFLVSAGCAAPPRAYEFSKSYKRYLVERQPAPRFDVEKRQVERGKPIKWVDNMGHYFFSAPMKLLLWDRRIGNHKISKEDELLVYEYLEANDLDRVKVRLNQYAPGAEFMRLWRNSDVNPFYRATFGLVYWLKYTVLPERLFAGFIAIGDNYNPYTNTVNIYSGHNAMIVQRAARAKDLAQRKYKGTYAMLGLVPGMDLYQQGRATGDTVRYFYWWRDKDKESASYEVLYPDFATHFGQIGLAIGPIPAVVYAVVAVPGAVVGHVSGRSQRDKRLKQQDPPSWQALSAGKKP